jgi:cystathionine gamma-lyase
MAEDDLPARLARALHFHAQSPSRGDPLAPGVAATSAYHLPGAPEAPYQYGRFHNPTWDAVEGALALIEDAPTVAFPSGMAATAAVFYAFLKRGDRVLLPADGYYTTRALAERFLAPFGVFVDRRRTARFAEGGFAGYRLVWIETPSNPGLELCDIAAIAAAAKAAGALVAVDNTTMTPLGQRPLALGADLVVSSDTKAVNGHSDALFGHVSGRDPALVGSVRDWRRLAGAIPGPFEAWQVHRGLQTLELRFQRMCATAALVAEGLAGHKAVVAVRYPGLPADPAHALAKRQMAAFGHLIGVTFASAEAADAFIDGCPLLAAATSFGGAKSSAERRRRWGDDVAEGFVRLSIGIEPAAALWAAMAAALDALGRAR